MFLLAAFALATQNIRPQVRPEWPRYPHTHYGRSDYETENSWVSDREWKSVPLKIVPPEQENVDWCSGCRTVVNFIKGQMQSGSVTVEAIRMAVQTLCDGNAVVKAVCQAMVDGFVPKCIELLRDGMGDFDVCSAIQFCSENKRRPCRENWKLEHGRWVSKEVCDRAENDDSQERSSNVCLFQCSDSHPRNCSVKCYVPMPPIPWRKTPSNDASEESSSNWCRRVCSSSNPQRCWMQCPDGHAPTIAWRKPPSSDASEEGSSNGCGWVRKIVDGRLVPVFECAPHIKPQPPVWHQEGASNDASEESSSNLCRWICSGSDKRFCRTECPGLHRPHDLRQESSSNKCDWVWRFVDGKFTRVFTCGLMGANDASEESSSNKCDWVWRFVDGKFTRVFACGLMGANDASEESSNMCYRLPSGRLYCEKHLLDWPHQEE